MTPLKGHGKATVACRVDILGGLFPLSSQASAAATPGACLFCHEAATDTLHHLLHQCPMNRWAPLLPEGWCSQAMDLIRSRYMVSEISAILELGCPLDTSAPSHLQRSGPNTNRKRRRRAMAIIPYDDVLRAQTARSSPVLAESVAMWRCPAPTPRAPAQRNLRWDESYV